MTNKQGRTSLNKEDLLSRIKWKEMLRAFENNAPDAITSPMYEEKINTYHNKFFSKDAPLKSGVLNHYRRLMSTPSKDEISTNYENISIKSSDYRVPKLEHHALCIVWALEDFKAIPKESYDEEKDNFLQLIGFSYTSRETYNRKRRKLKDATDFLNYAAEMSCDNTDSAERTVVEIHSAIGFHAAGNHDLEFIESITHCLRCGVVLIYVIQEMFDEKAEYEYIQSILTKNEQNKENGIPETESEVLNNYIKYIRPKCLTPVLTDLFDKFSKIIDREANKAFKDQIFIRIDPESHKPRIQDAYTRIAILNTIRDDAALNTKPSFERVYHLLNTDYNDRTWNFQEGIIETIRSDSSEQESISTSSWHILHESFSHVYHRLRTKYSQEEHLTLPLFSEQISKSLAMPNNEDCVNSLKNFFHKDNNKEQWS